MNSIRYVAQSAAAREANPAKTPVTGSVAAALQRLLTTTAKLWQLAPSPIPGSLAQSLRLSA